MDLPPLPSRLQQRPQWHGLPIPFTAFIGPDGTPDFKVLDTNNHHACLYRKLCGLCGQQLGEVIVFIGGPSCVSQHVFIDPGMHEECALFAAQVCTFLANATGHYSEKQLKHLNLPDVAYQHFEGSQTSNNRPAKMALFYTKGFHLVLTSEQVVIMTEPPFKVDWQTMPSREES